jgi:glycerophosphoryl diester phosphodiesterase
VPVIELRRPPGRFARVGHRGASALAPENSLDALELAVELGCDMLEFDVLPLHDGTLVLAHSDRDVRTGIATLDDALALAARRLPETGLQLDVKRRGCEEGVLAALRRHGVLERSWVSGFDPGSLRRFAELEPALPRSYTLPRDRLAISKRGPFAPVLRGGLPRRLPALLRRARAVAATLHYSIASAAAISRAHDLGAAVYVWTVDDPIVAQRLVAAEADGIITNDPRIFANVTM